jgi:hypothetical protein
LTNGLAADINCLMKKREKFLQIPLWRNAV